MRWEKDILTNECRDVRHKTVAFPRTVRFASLAYPFPMYAPYRRFVASAGTGPRPYIIRGGLSGQQVAKHPSTASPSHLHRSLRPPFGSFVERIDGHGRNWQLPSSHSINPFRANKPLALWCSGSVRNATPGEKVICETGMHHPSAPVLIRFAVRWATRQGDGRCSQRHANRMQLQQRCGACCSEADTLAFLRRQRYAVMNKEVNVM